MAQSDYWKLRVENIKDTVSIRNLIDHFGIECQSEGIITQVHCPFHGNDLHASAKIYETNTMYCFVCNETWDVIEFIREMKKTSFVDACVFLEDLYGLEKPDKEATYTKKETLEEFLESQKNPQVKEKDFEKDFERISSLMVRNRDFFKFEDYVKCFYYFDNLFYIYKSEKYNSDLEIQLGLNHLSKEISSKN